MTSLLAPRQPFDPSSSTSTPHSKSLPNPPLARKNPNPFARPKLTHEPQSFTRTTLLPSFVSPILPTTPIEKIRQDVEAVSEKGKIGREGWRMLWRGGIEIGSNGWRLEGVTFFARLSFPPSTPSAERINPFDNPSPAAGSPFATLPSGDTDLCLSLESMRGRKYLQVRGVVDLPGDEVLEGEEGGGLQMSIAPNAPLLAAYFTNLLCRTGNLSSSGRTLNAIRIGLGDEHVDSPHTSTVLVYGQISSTTADTPSTLRLHVGRRKPSPPATSENKVRPGEPLPRVPLFFPTKAPNKPKGPFARSNSRAFSRAQSTNSIYHPPQPPAAVAPTPVNEKEKSAAPVSGRTPGRRGEKRPRKEDDDEGRKRKAGRIVLHRQDSNFSVANGNITPDLTESLPLPFSKVENGDEDIFGKRGSMGPPLLIPAQKSLMDPTSTSMDEGDVVGEVSSAKARRIRVPQQVSDNKAAIRKQTLLILGERGIHRDHEMFKDVFGMTTKGVYFAFRDRLENGVLGKDDIRRIVIRHLDMYLSPLSVTEELPVYRVGIKASEEENIGLKEGIVAKGEEVKSLFEVEGAMKVEKIKDEEVEILVEIKETPLLANRISFGSDGLLEGIKEEEED